MAEIRGVFRKIHTKMGRVGVLERVSVFFLLRGVGSYVNISVLASKTVSEWQLSENMYSTFFGILQK